MLSPRSSQAISLRLTPMQIPATVAADVSQQAGRWQQTSDAVSQLSLVLRPGEPSEMVVQIRNLGAQSLQLALQVEGDFPPTWCQIGTEGTELRSGQQTEAVLYFQLAPDFFEHHQALRPGETLKLNYRGRLSAQTLEPETGRRQIETADFNLWVRPHTLYPGFLPAIYGEIDFIGRFLKIFEQSFEPSVQTLDTLWASLDPLTAPTSLLPFLAHWVGWQLVPYLSLERQRSLIRNAITIYRWRGTRRGLRLYLHLATGLPLDDHLPESEKHISITESFHQGFVTGVARLGEDAILGGGRPFYFKVQLRPEYPNQIDEALVRSIIEQETPAFCSYDLWISAPSTTALESS
ncbi:MAG TPA: phage tail protein [Microcoleaceae cyanobacterium]